MTYVRDLVLTITILALIYIAANRPPPPLPQNAPLCIQPFFNKQGQLTTQQWVPCQDLDRFEQA